MHKWHATSRTWSATREQFTDVYECKFPNRIQVAWGSYGVQELTNLFIYEPEHIRISASCNWCKKISNLSKICYRSLSKGHAVNDCKVNPCGINGCIKKHNGLLHSENQFKKGNHAVIVRVATFNQSREFASFLQIVLDSIQRGGNR